MPAIIFADGFDTYTTILDKWDLILGVGNASSSSIASGVGRGGAGAFQSIAGNSLGGTAGVAQIRKNVGAQTTLYVGFALNWNGFSPIGAMSADSILMSFADGSSGVQVALWIKPSGTMYVTRGGSPATNVLGTSASSYPSNSYHYVEMNVVINGTTGVVVVKVDQTVVINLTGQNTKATSNSSFDSVFIGNSTVVGGSVNISGYTGLFDDVYFDTAGFNGDVRVSGQLPSGDGSTQNFSNVEAGWVLSTITNLQTTIIDSNSNLQRATANTGDFKTGTIAPTWATGLGATTTDNHVTWTNLGSVSQYKLVNETNPDGDSSYIQSNTLNDISRFTYPAVSGSGVLAVIIWAYSRKDDGGFRTIQGSVKSGGTVGTTGTDMALGTNYQMNMLQSLTDPNTGAAWTLPAVNAAEFGIKITN
jgi:hypothetical protein